MISCIEPSRRNSSDAQLLGWKGVGMRTEIYENFLLEVMKVILSRREDNLTALCKQYTTELTAHYKAAKIRKLCFKSFILMNMNTHFFENF